jgi:hypothetical protein
MGEQKIYKTMQGKTIDFDSLRLSNELVPAVGNMKVNARGDEIRPNGEIVRSRDEITEEKTQVEIQKIQETEFSEDFGPEPELTPEQAQEILSKKKLKPQEK